MNTWIDNKDPRTTIAVVMMVIMIVLVLAIAVVGISVLSGGTGEKMVWIASMSAAVSGMGSSFYRFQYLYESRMMVSFFSKKIDEVRSDIRERYA